MVFYTSDLHIGHANILKYCERPFQSVDEMNETLVENWNRKVCRGDAVYVLGDVFFRNSLPASTYLERMKGKKHLIIGNHDRGRMKKTDLTKYFESVSMMTEIMDGNRKLTLRHYPMLTWNKCGRGTYHVYGHVHNQMEHGYGPVLATMPDAFNACVDVNEFEPVSFQELVENNARIKQLELWQ